jgi:hypothetical protein
VKKSNPRARSDTERPVSRLPAPGLETTSKIKLSRRQRTAATTDFPTRTGVRAGTSEAWKVGGTGTGPPGTTFLLAYRGLSGRTLPLVAEDARRLWPMRGPA